MYKTCYYYFAIQIPEVGMPKLAALIATFQFFSSKVQAHYYPLFFSQLFSFCIQIATLANFLSVV